MRRSGVQLSPAAFTKSQMCLAPNSFAERRSILERRSNSNGAPTTRALALASARRQSIAKFEQALARMVQRLVALGKHEAHLASSRLARSIKGTSGNGG